ncbi:MAG: hypothetical protein ACM3XR_06455 [Bacillota bacterium]
MKSSRTKKLFHVFAIVLSAVLIAVLALVIYAILDEDTAHIYPGYPKIDLTPILSKDYLGEADYKMIYFQSGLGKPAVDELRSRYPDSTERILRIQDNFFGKVRYICEPNSPVSREERLVDEKGKPVNGTELASIQNGDILVTKSSHTYGWRNGHSAIVIDAANGKTLESVVLGTNSTIQDISKWTKYPNFVLLRLKDASPELRENIARTAVKNLFDIPYDLFVGIFNTKFKTTDKIASTHCSHLVWQAYRMHGFDLDSDGGPLVTPNDIANSPLLEIVQVYGVDPGNIWP